MPQIIDERVVEMQFNNKKFEENAQTSLKTLGNLKKSLNFNGAAKGLQQFEKVSNGINLSGMTAAIQTIQNRFSVLGIAGARIIQQLTDSAINMARRIGSEFTIAPIKSGFQEYETQINSVQTILANTSSKGKTLEDVNAALDELNAYADKTIYNFTEMTRNIGTFTAAGVDLDTSTEAIKGIANLAAISGSTSQQASTAMYQLSQALASGTVKLMDWNSVVNAGMGGEVFQNALKDTARLHGKVIDQMISDEGSFRETLSKGWLSAEILTETLQKFTGDLTEDQLIALGYTKDQAREIYKMGVTANNAATKVKTFTQLFDTLKEAAQSGWTQSWEIIVGDFEEAKELLTSISDKFGEAIGDSANARNLILQQWKDLGGRTKLIESFKNAFEGIQGLVWSVKNAFREIFPEVTADNLFAITERIHQLTEQFKNLFGFSTGAHYSIVETSVGEMLDKDKFAVLGPVLEKISRIFKGFFAVLEIGFQGASAFSSLLFSGIKKVLPVGGSLLDILASVGDWLVFVRDSVKEKNLFGGWIESIKNFYRSIPKTYEAVKKAFRDIYLSLTGKELGEDAFLKLDEFVAIFKEKFGSLEKIAAIPKKVFEYLSKIWTDDTGKVKGIGDIFSSAVGIVFDTLGKLIETLKKFGVNFGTIIKTLSLISTLKFLLSLIGIAKSIKKVSSGFSGALESFSDLVGALKGENKIGKNLPNSILKIAISVGILAYSLYKLAQVDTTKLIFGAGIIAVLGFAIYEFMNGVSKLTANETRSISKVSGSLVKIGIGIFLLSRALIDLSAMDIEGMKVGLLALGGILGELIIFMNLTKGTSLKGGGSIAALGISVMLLAHSLKGLSELQPDKMYQGVKGLGLVLLELAAFTQISAKKGGGALSLITVGLSVMLLAHSLKGLSELQPDKMYQGVKGLGLVLLELAAFIKLSSGFGNFKNSLGLLIALPVIGGALYMFTETIKNLSAFSSGKILGIMASFGIMLLSLSASFSILGKLPISGAVSALANLAIAVAGITGIVSLIGAIAQIPGFDWLITEGGNALGLIGSAIGKFIHGIINPSGQSSPAKETKTLADFGNELSAFMTNIQPFIEGAKRIDEAALNGVKNLAGMCMTITGAQFLEGIVSFITGEASIEEFGNKLVPFGEKLVEFSNIVAGVNTEAVTSAANAGTMLSNLATGLPKEGGLISLFEGENSLASFGTDLASFGTDLKSFSESVSGIDSEAITSATNSAKMLSDFAQNVPEQSILEKALGLSSNLSTFANDLSILGPSLKTYSDSITDIDADAVSASANAAQSLADFAQNVPEQSILEKAIGAQSNLKIFAADLIELGPSIKEYSDSVKNIDADSVSASANAAKALTDFAQNVPEQSILEKALGMKSNLSAFAADLIELGPSIKEYADSVTGIDENAVLSSTRAAGMLNDFADTLTKQGGLLNTLSSWITGDKSMSKFSEELATFGSKMNEFASYFGNNAPNDIPGAVTTAGGIVDSLKELFSEGEDSKGFTGSIANITRLLDSLLLQLTIYFPNFYEMGSSLMSNISAGMTSVSNYPINTLISMMNSCVTSLNSYKDDFYIIGQNYGVGIANGIMSRASAAIAAANRIANAAINASRRGFNEHSPSKEGYDIGAFFTEGIANGMLQVADLTNRASEQVSSEAIHSAQTAMSMINSIIEDGDTTPTIRPVLDLSNITNGADLINSIIGQTKTLTADAINVRSLNQRAMTLQSGINQNGTIGRTGNRDVVEAINNLGSRIDTMNEDIRNLKLVLNTGVVAGALEPEINRRLGLRMAYEERGV